MAKYYHPDADFLRKLEVAEPETTAHGTDEDVRKHLQSVTMTDYRLEGNMLIAKTELGEVMNILPPEYILHGVDSAGMPILRKFDE